MTGPVMVYGATGFSGRPIAEQLRNAGRDVVVAGRDEEKVLALARALDAPCRVFDLDDPREVALALTDVKAVLHAAGPFLSTAVAMMEACVHAGVHYLDLSGEWPVFAFAQRLGALATDAGVMLMPGVGCSIVVSDCLLARAAKQVPGASLLRLAVSLPALPSGVSRGTFRSALDLVSKSVIVRRAGVVRTIPLGGMTRTFDFGAGERASMAFSWPDVITGQHTTGVGDIEGYVEAPALFRLAWKVGAEAVDLFGEPVFRAAIPPVSALWPARPPEAAQARERLSFVVEAIDPWRRVTRFGLRTLDGYAVTTATAVAAVGRVLGGEHSPGFRTPSEVFGPDFVGDLECVWPYDAGPLASAASGTALRRFC